MKITVRTRSQNPVLYERMRGFIPPYIDCIPHTGYSEWKDAAKFLHDAIETTEDILLVLDEDAFITNWPATYSLCAMVKNDHYTHAGVPDGGVIGHRTHSFLTINPFLAIFNCRLITPWKARISRKRIDHTPFSPELEQHKPDWITGPFNHDSKEPFSGIFYWLAGWGKPLFLNALTGPDNITTEVIGPDGLSLCLHSWYSREYETNKLNKKRIDQIYYMALRNKKAI